MAQGLLAIILLSETEKAMDVEKIMIAIVICLFIPSLPAYLAGTGTRLTSSEILFENADQESGLPDSGENELKVLGPTVFFCTFLLGINGSEQFSHEFSRALARRRKIFILRC